MNFNPPHNTPSVAFNLACLGIALSLQASNSWAFDFDQCDKVRHSTVPYNVPWWFGLAIDNPRNQKAYLNRFKIEYLNPEYLSPPKNNGESFVVTDEMKKLDRVLPESISGLRILRSDGNFIVIKKPEKKTDFDFAIKYSVWFDYNNTPWLPLDDQVYVSCIKYKVTYCGDNSIDSRVEECDDGNQNNGDGCSSSCKNE